MKPKLLITGGTGFVGYHLIEEALQRGYEVDVAVRTSSKTDHLREFSVNYVHLNLADEAAVTKDLERNQYDCIIHAAGATKAKSLQQYELINADYSANLAKAAMASGRPLRKFVFISSLAAVGPMTPDSCSAQEGTFSPITPYGKSKLKAERLLLDIDALPLIILRPTAVYGPREKDLFVMFRLFAKGFEPYIGNAPQHLSFVYVKDLAKVVMNALEAPVSGRAYNISDGLVYNRRALADYTKKILGIKTRLITVPAVMVKLIAAVFEGGGLISGKMPVLNRAKIRELTASWSCNIEAAKKELNFDPAYNLEAGLQETLAWYRENGWL